MLVDMLLQNIISLSQHTRRLSNAPHGISARACVKFWIAHSRRELSHSRGTTSFSKDWYRFLVLLNWNWCEVSEGLGHG